MISAQLVNCCGWGYRVGLKLQLRIATRTTKSRQGKIVGSIHTSFSGLAIGTTDCIGRPSPI